MGASPSRVWIDFHPLSYRWWFLFLRWHRRFLELNFYRDDEQLLLWFPFLFSDTSLSTDKCLNVEKWAGKGTRSQSWVGHHIEGIACLRTADCTIGFMLTQAVSKPLPGMACLLATFITCDVRSALRLLGRNGGTVSCRGIAICPWNSPQALGELVHPLPDSYTTSELYLGHCSGLWLQGAAFRGDVMSFSRQRAASADSEAPASQTLVQLWCLPAAAIGSLDL